VLAVGSEEWAACREDREEPQINADDADQDRRKSFDRINRMNKKIEFHPV
jgi:hypothetical protein